MYRARHKARFSYQHAAGLAYTAKMIFTAAAVIIILALWLNT